MDYQMLLRWSEENNTQNLFVNEILKFEDQIILFDKALKISLQINLSSENSFPFFTMNTYPLEAEKTFFWQLKQTRMSGLEILTGDRIIRFFFKKIDIYNQTIIYELIAEFIPRFQNLVLCKQENGQSVILDSLKKFSFADNPERQILPGLPYTPPPAGNFVREVASPIKPLTVKNGIFTADGEHHLSVNSAFTAIFDFILKNRLQKKIVQKTKALQAEIARKNHKLQKLNDEFSATAQEDTWRIFAELLKANLPVIQPNQTSITVTNYCREPYTDTIDIPLDITKSPKKNMDYYFKKYRKARDGKNHIQVQIEKTQEEIELLEAEIFEIEEDDYFAQPTKKKTQQEKAKPFKRLKITEDWEILMGRTATENDLLTAKTAKPNDWWFHCRVFQGAHVVLRNYKKQQVPANLLSFCCRIAAYYSRAKNSSNVPVDYTQIRFVRKPNGAAKGYVVYTNQKTNYCEPLSLREAAKNLPQV